MIITILLFPHISISNIWVKRLEFSRLKVLCIRNQLEFRIRFKHVTRMQCPLVSLKFVQTYECPAARCTVVAIARIFQLMFRYLMSDKIFNVVEFHRAVFTRMRSIIWVGMCFAMLPARVNEVHGEKKRLGHT
jgi:hypothetical protein